MVSFKLTLGRLAFAGRDLFTNEAIAALYLQKNAPLSNKFLYWYLTYFDWDAAAANDQKIKGKTLNKEKLKLIPVILPPLPEQKRIVEVLDKAFEGLAIAKANAEANLQNARELFQSHLAAAFSNEALEKGWEVKTLSDFSAINYGYTESAKTDPVGPKFLRITDIQDGRVNWQNVPFCPISEEDHKQHALRSGDIVFARTGATTGKSFLLKDPPNAVCASYLIRVRANARVVRPDFLAIYFQTEAYWTEIRRGIEGAAQGGFNSSKLGALRIPVPPLPKQKCIVVDLAAVKERTADLERVYQEKTNKCDLLKQSLLQKAFAGELT